MVENLALQHAIELASTGKKAEARASLKEIVRNDKNNVTAWRWLAQVAESRQAAITCLQQVLRLKPGDEWATKVLSLLDDEQPAPPPDGAGAATRPEPAHARITTLAPQELPGGYQLGTPTAEYRAKSGIIALWIVSGPVLFVAPGIVIIYFGSTTMLRGLISDGLALAAFGLLLLGVSIFILRRRFVTLNGRMLIFPDGLIEIKGRTQTVIRWDDIMTLRHVTGYRPRGAGCVLVIILLALIIPDFFDFIFGYYLFRQARAHYKIVRHDGTVFRLENIYRRVEWLWETIEREVTGRLLPDTITTLNNGGKLQFEKLLITQQALIFGKKTIAWREVESVEIKGAHIVIKNTGKLRRWATIPLSKIPNVALLRALSDRLISTGQYE